MKILFFILVMSVGAAMTMALANCQGCYYPGSNIHLWPHED